MGERNSRAALAGATSRGWPAHGGGPQGIRYSPLDQINRTNVRQLEVAWTYDSGEEGGLQASPIVVDGVVYTTTPKHHVVALDAATGTLLWKFDSGIERQRAEPRRDLLGERRRPPGVRRRGPFRLRARRATGKPDRRLRPRRAHRPARGPRPRSADAVDPPDHARRRLQGPAHRRRARRRGTAGDARRHPRLRRAHRRAALVVPHHSASGRAGYETWPADAWKYSGGANNWAGMALDEERGIVFVPTGSAASDFYGADRAGDNLFANSLLALDAATGKRIWHFQAVHHDIWDRDFPSPPSLVTVTRDGARVDAVAQTTKQGYVFLFDRATASRSSRSKTHRFPPSAVDGEVAAKTQPLPDAARAVRAPAPDRGDAHHAARRRRTQAVLERFRKLRSDGQFVPFSVGQGHDRLPRLRRRRGVGRLGLRSRERRCSTSTPTRWRGRAAWLRAMPATGGRTLYLQSLRVVPPRQPARRAARRSRRSWTSAGGGRPASCTGSSARARAACPASRRCRTTAVDALVRLPADRRRPPRSRHDTVGRSR